MVKKASQLKLIPSKLEPVMSPPPALNSLPSAGIAVLLSWTSPPIRNVSRSKPAGGPKSGRPARPAGIPGPVPSRAR